jgi:hypothetical protein
MDTGLLPSNGSGPTVGVPGEGSRHPARLVAPRKEYRGCPSFPLSFACERMFRTVPRGEDGRCCGRLVSRGGPSGGAGCRLTLALGIQVERGRSDRPVRERKFRAWLASAWQVPGRDAGRGAAAPPSRDSHHFAPTADGAALLGRPRPVSCVFPRVWACCGVLTGSSAHGRRRADRVCSRSRAPCQR